MFERISRHVLFHEMHRSIEESATISVKRLMAGEPEVDYPPNGGFCLDELAALKSIPRSPAMERGLRKLIADAAVYPLFHLCSLADGIVEPPALDDVHDRDRIVEEIMLHDGLLESYWAWRRRRPERDWHLDTYQSE